MNSALASAPPSSRGGDSLLILSASDVSLLTRSLTAAVLTVMIARTLHAISSDSKEVLAPGGVAGIQNPARIATETESHKTLYMPSRLTTSKGVSMTACKVVAVPKPAATVEGLPATTLLFDETTGKCRAVVNAGELTGLRTAAASALATRLLASPTSQHLAIFGTGTQSYYHARLILELFPSIKLVTLIARSLTARATALAEKVQLEFLNVEVRTATSEETSAVLPSADIVCCCVPSTSPLFTIADLSPTAHINAIGSYTPKMQEFPPALLSTLPFILVDSRPACLLEAGELVSAGTKAEQCVELGEVVDKSGEVEEGLRERIKGGGRSLYKGVGVGGMDVAVTEVCVEMAEKMGLGVRVPY